MLDTIVSWFNGVIGEALQWVIDQLYSQLSLSLSAVYGNFKPLATAYHILQACAIGLILAIAAWNLLKFFGGSLTKVHETPIAILVRCMFATMLVFMGGYIVSMVVDIASVPYKTFMSIDAIRFGAEDMPSFSDGFGFADALDISAGPFIDLILILLVAWNLIKLVVEIVERYLMVGVLAYTAPIFYPFLCSSSSTPIFMKWVGMFVGQCALMSVSVMFTTLVIACFSPSGESAALLRLVFGLAMCKVAQRADTYMQQLGIGVGTTGGNLLDDIVGFGSMIGRGLSGGGGSGSGGGSGGGGSGGGGGGNSRNSVLGMAAGMGGLVGFGANMVRNFQEGKPIKSTVASAAKSALQNSIPGMKTMQNRKAAVAQRAVEMQQKFGERASYWNKVRGQGSNAKGPVDKDYTKMAQEAGMTAQQYAQVQHNLNGSGTARVAPPGDKNPNPGDQSAAFELNKAAKSVGLTLGSVQYSGGRLSDGDNSLHDATILRGPDNMVADHIRENYNVNQSGLKDASGKIDQQATDDYNTALADTMTYGPSIVAEDVLFGSEKTLQGNDELSSAALKGAFGDNLRLDTVGGEEGKLSDIKVETTPIQRTRDGQLISGGGRVLTGSYVAPVRGNDGKVLQRDGKDVTYTSQLTIMDDVAYSQLDPAAQQQMEMVQSKSGWTYYVKRPEIQHSKVQSEYQAQQRSRSARERFRNGRKGRNKQDN